MSPRKKAAASATREQNLFAGNPVWKAASPHGLRMKPLTQSIKTDIVIVGAGVSGAFMAEALSRRNPDVVVLERRGVASGSTAASTAMLQWEIDQPLTELADKIGGAAAARAWRRSYGATQALMRLVAREKIGCDLSQRSALYVSGNTLGARALQKEADARERAGLPGRYLDHKALAMQFGIDRPGAILSPGSASADPVKLTKGLLARAVARGARVFAPVEVKDIAASRNHVVVQAGDYLVEARACVFCTGYERLKGLPENKQKISSTWAIASRPGARYPAWLDHTLVWEASDPYLYLRAMAGGRLIVGGEDEGVNSAVHRAQSLGKKTAALIAKASALIPDAQFGAGHAWTGAFGESKDGLPFIDAVPGMPGCYAVMGFGGNGTIYSQIAAQIVPALIAGRLDPDRGLFQFR